jgi:hypothetical protein
MQPRGQKTKQTPPQQEKPEANEGVPSRKTGKARLQSCHQAAIKPAASVAGETACADDASVGRTLLLAAPDLALDSRFVILSEGARFVFRIALRSRRTPIVTQRPRPIKEFSRER